MLPKKKSSWKKALRIDPVEVVAVHELRLLAFFPFPDVQIVEFALAELDGDQEIFVPVPVDSNPSPWIFGFRRMTMISSGK